MPDSARIRVLGWRALIWRMAATPAQRRHRQIDDGDIGVATCSQGGGLHPRAVCPPTLKQPPHFPAEQQTQTLREQFVVVDDHDHDPFGTRFHAAMLSPA